MSCHLHEASGGGTGTGSTTEKGGGRVMPYHVIPWERHKAEGSWEGLVVFPCRRCLVLVGSSVSDGASCCCRVRWSAGGR